MPDEITPEDIANAALEPAEASTPQGTVKARSIDDMIKAADYQAAASGAASRRSGWAGLRPARAITQGPGPS